MNTNTPTSLSDWLIYMQSIHVSAIDMGLERVLPVADKLGIFSLEHQPYVFTVAGTNGKGSTTATIASICQAAGYKTALYQSPHLVSFNERISINGLLASDDELINAFQQVEQARPECELTLSFFEMTTLAAFWIFKHANCDVWVLEVGLGGRLDVVNIIDPDMCVITNIGIDHTDWLGDTREQIGFEKAGILRQNSTLIFGETDMPNSVKTAINDKQATCYQRGVDFEYLDNGYTWLYSSAALTLALPKPTISLENASVAVSAVLASKLDINHAQLATGLTMVKLSGRFDKRFIHQRHWLFDVGHNEHGVAFLMKQFMPDWQTFQNTHPTAQLHVVFSMLADKDIDKVLSLLANYNLPIVTWYIGTIDNGRAMDSNTLAQKITTYLPNTTTKIYDNIAQAITGVLTGSQEQDMVLCFGSFHTISESLIALGAAKDPKNS